MSEVVPAAVRLAAKRGFLRTWSQSFAATIPSGGVSVAAVLGFIQEPDPLLIAAIVLSSLLSPVLGGTASYFSILSSGIPEEYVEAGSGRYRAED